MSPANPSEYSQFPDWEALFADRAFLHRWLRKALAEVAAHWPQDEVTKLYLRIAEASALRSIEVIHTQAKSPPERIFLVHILTAFLLRDPLSLVVPPPDLYLRLGTAADNALALEELAAQTGSKAGDLEPLLLSEQERFEQLGITQVYGTLGVLDAVHMVPQARLVGVAGDDPLLEPLERKTYDILFYKLNRPDLRLVVECDGYEAHRRKKPFTADRQRDRLLRRAGFDVLRFSAAEIFKRPTAVSLELQDYIETKWDFEVFFQPS